MTGAPVCHVLTPDTAHLLEGASVFDHPVRPDQLAAFLADPGHDLVFATLAERVVGFASGTVLLHPDKPPAFFINEVGVDEDHRRRGIAGLLCRCLIDRARERGCRGVWLATEPQNDAARALYRRLGAEETTGIVVYDWDGAMQG